MALPCLFEQHPPNISALDRRVLVRCRHKVSRQQRIGDLISRFDAQAVHPDVDYVHGVMMFDAMLLLNS